MEYGNGIMGDMCIHMLDMIRWMLGLRLAKKHFLHRAGF
jgi:predicted dehydrogenase